MKIEDKHAEKESQEPQTSLEKKGEILWWQKEIIYQIYPRSFMDANNDGIGDLQGINARLDYLEWLGIRAIWISPIYSSPMADFGYDISNYTEIHPFFGNMQDFDELLEAAHNRNIRIIMDLVPNHTSAEHEWFRESRSSRDNPKRDWYIWKDPGRDGSPPNNWLSEFGGSAWEFDGTTGQYYYHSFLKEQPDLNWYNPEVREAIWDIMRFWLRKGVDGFRVDVLWCLIKDKLFRDNPPNPQWHEGLPEHDKLIPVFSSDQPHVHEVVAEMRKVTDEFDDRVLIGEIYLPISKLIAYYGREDNSGVHLPFNFHLLLSKWDAAEINSLIARYEAALPVNGWPNWVLGNHDKPRVRTRVGGKQVWNVAMLLLTLRGTPTMYYGDEIGMGNVDIPKEKVRDPREFNEPGLGVGRDPERTPMQWTEGLHGGFSLSEPWLPVGRDIAKINVGEERRNRFSLLSFYRKLIHLRQQEPALYRGDYIPVGVNHQLLVYKRRYQNTEFMICMNLGENWTTFEPDFKWTGKVEVSNNRMLEGTMLRNSVSLAGGECLLIRLNGE